MTLMKLLRLSAPKSKSRLWLNMKKSIRRRLVVPLRKNLRKNLKKSLRSLQLQLRQLLLLLNLLLLLPQPLIPELKTKRMPFSML